MTVRIGGHNIEGAALAGVEKRLILQLFDRIDGDDIADMVTDICADVLDPFQEDEDGRGIEALNKLSDDIWEHVALRALTKTMTMLVMGERMGSDGTVRKIGK